MPLKKKVLRIDELRPGMVSAGDIIYQNKILLAKDISITKSIIDRLKQNYIVNNVDVYVEYNSEPLIVNTETVQELQDTFNELSFNLKDVFYKVSNLRVPEIEDIRQFTEKIQEEFSSTGIVVRNIVFYGSGNDTIYRHSINVAAISSILGRWIGLDDKEINLLTYSAILHDFGKVKLDKHILAEEYNFGSEGYKIFKTHPTIGYNLVKKIPYLSNSIAYGILMHHERMDGSGYPLGIKEDKIHKFARIIAIADLFDEVNSENYYKSIAGPFEALKVIQNESLGKLDCKYTATFLNHIIDYYIGENVILNNNQTYKILQININDLTNPLLFNENGFLDLRKEKNLYIKSLVI